jgi:hypothetical protein
MLHSPHFHRIHWRRDRGVETGADFAVPQHISLSWVMPLAPKEPSADIRGCACNRPLPPIDSHAAARHEPQHPAQQQGQHLASRAAIRRKYRANAAAPQVQRTITCFVALRGSLSSPPDNHLTGHQFCTPAVPAGSCSQSDPPTWSPDNVRVFVC